MLDENFDFKDVVALIPLSRFHFQSLTRLASQLTLLIYNENQQEKILLSLKENVADQEDCQKIMEFVRYHLHAATRLMLFELIQASSIFEQQFKNEFVGKLTRQGGTQQMKKDLESKTTRYIA